MTQVDGFVADPWRGAGEARAGWCFGFVALAHGGDNRYRVRVGLGQGRTFISQRWEREFDAVNEALAAFGFRFDASAPHGFHVLVDSFTGCGWEPFGMTSVGSEVVVALRAPRA